MKWFKIGSIIFVLMFTACSGSGLYQTKGGYKRHHTKYKTDKSHQQAKSEEGKTFSMVCSFYADKFHGKPTASGEIFDMYKFTCAHKQFPFDTQLQVTDPDTGKSVEVRVNDRGPFIPGRDLDLSYAAANQIGLIPYGVRKLQVKILNKP